MKTLYIATASEHGEGANPGLTDDGIAKIKALRPLLPKNPTRAVVGAGERHRGVYIALGLDVAPTYWTSSVGGPEYLEKSRGQSMVVLANGRRVTRASYTTFMEGGGAMLAVLNNAIDGTIICSDRAHMNMLGLREAKDGALYSISFEGRLVDSCATNLDFQEVQAEPETA